jgi:hypothetical protein
MDLHADSRHNNAKGDEPVDEDVDEDARRRRTGMIIDINLS